MWSRNYERARSASPLPEVRLQEPNAEEDGTDHTRSLSVNSHNTNTPLLSSAPYSPAMMDTPDLRIPAAFRDSRNSSFVSTGDHESVHSLSINYVPSKFSSTVLSGGPKRRKNWKAGPDDVVLPKLGGGREAFRANEARMAGENDEDDDLHPGGHTRTRMRWNRFKWILFICNAVLTAYSIAGLISLFFIWFNTWDNVDIIRVGNHTELVISTLAASLGVFTALLGWSGILLNNRSFLSVYCLLLWIVFAFLVTPGYITYKTRTYNLQGKLNAQWSRELGMDGRLRIQNQLDCCGYFSPFVEATVSQTCYSRSVLPGCKAVYLTYQRVILKRWYETTFILVPFHICIMVTALLCSNHITYRFGKGMMPKAYRLTMNSMAVIMENYANQLAEQYGNDAASEFIERSRSDLMLDVPSSSSTSSFYGGK